MLVNVHLVQRQVHLETYPNTSPTTQYWAHFPLYCLHSKPVTPNIVRPSILKIDAEHN